MKDPPLTDSYVGAPGQDGSGVVEFRATTGERQVVAPPKPQPGLRFGAAVFSGQLIEIEHRSPNFLLVGAPGLTVDGKPDAGGIFVFERTGKTFRYLDLITQNDVLVRRSQTKQSTATRWHAQAGAEFGAAMDAHATEDYGATQVYVGVPGLDVGDARAAGGVAVLDLTKYIELDYSGKLPDVQGVLHTLDNRGSPRPPQSGDRLGTTLTTDWWGAPGATVDGQPGAGLAVAGLTYRIHHLGKDGVPGKPAAGDAFGSSFAPGRDGGIWIGVPGRDVDGVRDAGMVVGLERVAGQWRFRGGPAYTENDADGTRAEQGDRFGAALCAYIQYDRDPTALLLAGAPGKDVDGVTDAGAVIGMPDAPNLTARTTGGQVTASAHFGAQLSCGAGNTGKATELFIGAPGGQGKLAGTVVHGIHPPGDRPLRWNQWTLPNAEPGDVYGSNLVQRDWY
ncbi:hypothetical protein [Flindersiella endophytica]